MIGKTEWWLSANRSRMRAPIAGAKRFRLNEAPMVCERLAFDDGFAVCRVAAVCEQSMIFEAPASAQPRLHLQYVDHGACEFYSDKIDDALAPRTSRIFSDGGAKAAWAAKSGAAFDVLSVDVSESWLVAWFDGRLPDGVRTLLAGRGPYVSAPAVKGRAVLERLALTLARAPAGTPLRQMLVEGAAMQAVADCLDALVGDGQDGWGSDEKRLLHVRERLMDPWDEPPTVTFLAAEVGLSPRQLQRAFRDRFGVSLFRMLLDIRLDRAWELLKAGDVSIKEVAWRTGYTHAANFTHAFRARFNIAPSALQRRTDG